MSGGLPDWLDFGDLYEGEEQPSIPDEPAKAHDYPLPETAHEARLRGLREIQEKAAAPPPKPELPPDDRPLVTWEIREEPVTDDEELDFWELYDAGNSIGAIAHRFGRMPETVAYALLRLDVLEGRSAWEQRLLRDYYAEQKIRETIEQSQDPRLTSQALGFLDRRKKGAATVEELAIFEALGKLYDPDPDRFAQVGVRGGLPFGRSLDHSLPHGQRYVMDAHQRRMDALGSGKWARIVRADLKAAGMMPGGPALQSIRRFWS